MKRREFLQSAIAASALAGLGTAAQTVQAADPKGPGKREFYEMRVYRMKAGQQPDRLHAYLEKAAIPALNRLGCKNVGVFVEKEPKDPAGVFLLATYPTLDKYLAATIRLNYDREHLGAGSAYWQTPKTEAAFDRIDSWLMLAFAGMPKLELPAYSKERKPRLFELRTYESYSEAKALKKIDMFNDGEIDIMREVKLGPIFYGQALIGPNLPHLTYMTSAENEAAHKAHWDAFGKHPLWDKMKNDPQYADTVSKITRWILVPTPYSQI